MLHVGLAVLESALLGNVVLGLELPQLLGRADALAGDRGKNLLEPLLREKMRRTEEGETGETHDGLLDALVDLDEAPLRFLLEAMEQALNELL